MKDEPTVLDFLRTIFQRGEKIDLDEYFGENVGKFDSLITSTPKIEKINHSKRTSSSLNLLWVAMILRL